MTSESTSFNPAYQQRLPTGTPSTPLPNQLAHQILLANGIDPSRLTPQQFAAFQVQNPETQQRSIQFYLAQQGPAYQEQLPTGTPSRPLPNQAHQILLANGIDPSRLTPQQFAAFQLQNPETQQTAIQLYAQRQAQDARRILLENGIDPNRLTQQQFAAFQVQNPETQRRSIQLYKQSLAPDAENQRRILPQGMPEGVPQFQGNPGTNNGSPMISQNAEGAPMNTMPGFHGAIRNIPNIDDSYIQRGNAAIPDYQMKLMLLEQQNKKRMLMQRRGGQGELVAQRHSFGDPQIRN